MLLELLKDLLAKRGTRAPAAGVRDADPVEGLIERAERDWARGRHLGALEAMRAARDRAPHRLEIACRIGEMEHAHGALDRAAATFDAVLVADPWLATAHLGMARVLDALGRCAEAGAAFAAAGRLLLDQGQVALARDAYAAGIALGGTTRVDCEHGVVRVDLESGDVEGAIDRVLGLVAADPGDVEALRLLARGRYHLGQLEPAIEAYRHAATLEPGNATDLAMLGIVMRDAGSLDEGEANLRRAVAMDPAHDAAAHNLGLALFERGRHTEALGAFEACRVIRFGSPWGEAPPDLPTTGHPMTPPVVAPFKLRHDLEQLERLARLGKTRTPLAPAVAAYRAALDDLGPDPHNGAPKPRLDPRRHPLVCATFNRPAYIARGDAIDGPAINPALDTGSIEADYLGADPNLTYFDDLLTAPALEALWTFCLDSGIWHHVKRGYLGAYMHDGFFSGLLLQIATELAERLPAIFAGADLQTMWAYKYDSELLQGIGTHADQAAVNVNFWITPDAANLDPDSGGLVVYRHDAPQEWAFRKFNADDTAIADYLESVGSDFVRVPHRRNRAVMFDSDLFHRTDDFDFDVGYENRRINVTLLYGRR